MLLGLSPILTTGATVYANEEGNYVQVNSTTKELEQRMEALANQYKGVSLFETEFNKENMTPVQLELYNKVLDLQYDIALQNGSTNGMSREQYKQYLSNAMQGFIIQPRNAGHGLISVDVLGTVLDTALNVVLIIGGFGSVSAMVKALGQEGAKKFGAHYGIDLMELREPEEGEAIVAETTLTIDSSARHRLFLVDEDWAKAHDFNIQLYKKRLDCLSFSPSSNKWINSTHIPLTTKENKIRNAKDEIIADIQKLEEELPENCQQNKDYIFPFDDAFIKTDCGNIKIKEIKFEYENHTEMKQFKIDAQNITKAILKNTISKEVQLIGKTYMDYKSQMK